MKLSILLLVTSILLLNAVSCHSGTVVYSNCVQGSGSLKTESRNLAEFNAIETDGAFTVKVACQNSRQSLKVSADDNLLKHIITRLKGNTLQITTNKPLCTQNDILVEIDMKDLVSIASSGATDISIVKVHNRDFNLKMEGSGNVDISGRTDSFKARMFGSAELKAKEFKAKSVTLTIDGASQADVYAQDKLDVKVEGVGDVNYYGNPKEVNKEIMGVGSINKM